MYGVFINESICEIIYYIPNCCNRNWFRVKYVNVRRRYRYEYETWVREISQGAFHQNVIGRSQDKFARLPTSRVLRATPTKIQHPGDPFRLQKLYPLQICFFCALSAPRAFAKPNSVFKNISACIVLVRERTFYCHPYNVLKVSQFCRLAVACLVAFICLLL